MSIEDNKQDRDREEIPASADTSPYTLTAEEAELLDDPAAFARYFESQASSTIGALESESAALWRYPGTAVRRDTDSLSDEKAEALTSLIVADGTNPADLTKAEQELRRANKDASYVETAVPGVAESRTAAERLQKRVAWQRDHLAILSGAFMQLGVGDVSEEMSTLQERVQKIQNGVNEALDRIEEELTSTS